MSECFPPGAVQSGIFPYSVARQAGRLSFASIYRTCLQQITERQIRPLAERARDALQHLRKPAEKKPRRSCIRRNVSSRPPAETEVLPSPFSGRAFRDSGSFNPLQKRRYTFLSRPRLQQFGFSYIIYNIYCRIMHAEIWHERDQQPYLHSGGILPTGMSTNTARMGDS